MEELIDILDETVAFSEKYNPIDACTEFEKNQIWAHEEMQVNFIYKGDSYYVEQTWDTTLFSHHYDIHIYKNSVEINRGIFFIMSIRADISVHLSKNGICNY